jgi:DNA-binding transcriptional ArsR family regulator
VAAATLLWKRPGASRFAFAGSFDGNRRMMDYVDEVLRLAGLLASPTRLAAYRLVGRTGMGVTELAARLGVAPSTASYHLGELYAGGLVRVTRQGRRRVYCWAKTKWFVAAVEPR